MTELLPLPLRLIPGMFQTPSQLSKVASDVLVQIPAREQTSEANTGSNHGLHLSGRSLAVCYKKS